MLDDLFDRAGELGRIDGLLDGARAVTGRVLVVTGRRGDALLAGAARRALTAVEDAAGAAPLAAAAGDPPFAVTHGLYWLAVNASEAGPVLVAIDDLHWADQASLRFVLYLADRLAGLPVACQGGGDLGRWGGAAARRRPGRGRSCGRCGGCGPAGRDRGVRAGHAEAARLLAAEGADADAVCAHLLVCEPAGSIEVVAQLRAAAARAAGRGAPESAVAYLRRALAETADGACTRCCCTNWARHDVLNITVDPKTGKVSAWVMLDTAGGLLYGTLKVSRNPVTHGTVTGGTGTAAPEETGRHGPSRAAGSRSIRGGKPAAAMFP